MQISYDWLSEYLPVKIEVGQLSEILTTIGLEVEDIELRESVRGSLEGVVVGEVVSCEQHPNADRLKKTQVRVSESETLDIVCGAPNVAQGQKVLVARVGATLYPVSMPEGLTIRSSKIRGEKSEGMICAEDELGLGQSHDGIMILDADGVPGTPASVYLELPESQTVFHIGLTPNRSDAMSHLGVANDVLAYWNYHNKTNYKLNFSPEENLVTGNYDNPKIDITDPDLCKRFAAIVIDGVQVQPSPEWLKIRLESIGIRSVNNIVDISNYVLHEIGQPIHIYDYNQLSDDKTIAVQHPNQFSELVTLDKQTVKLHSEDIIIADTQKPLGLAGVMGGEVSSVQDSTTKIFIESASFNPKWIRRTSIRHQLRTEAAIHFEKSTSIDKVDKAVFRAVDLILKIAGGNISSPFIDLYPEKVYKKTVEFSYNYIRKICGKDYSVEDIDSILLNLGFEFKANTDCHSTVMVPYSKTDISQPADIAEEVLRIDGLNNVDIKSTIQFSLSGTRSGNRKFINKISDYLSHNGFQEILTNSIVNAQNYPGESTVKMMNSLSAELDAMRPDMCRSGLEVIEYNINRGSKDLLFYEIGNVYRVRDGEYNQSSILAIWCTGLIQPKQWMSEEEKVDVYWIKGILQNLWQLIGIRKYVMTEEDGRLLCKVGRDTIATIQLLTKKELGRMGIKQDVVYAEVHIEVLKQYMSQSVQYKALNKFPVMERDLSIIIPNDKKFSEIEKINSKIKAVILKNIRVFDIYEGESIGKGNKSWSMSYMFQSEDKTLTDSEVDEVMQNIMSLYLNDLKAEIRK